MLSSSSSSVTAVIPVRAGSRRLKNKNLADLNGLSLLENKIDRLKSLAFVTDILVSSDDDYMLDIASRLGTSVHKRSAIYCDEISAPFSEVINNIVSNVSADFVMWSTVTSPLISTNTYNFAYESFLKGFGQSFQSLISVTRYQSYIRHHNKPANYRTGRFHLPSQELNGYHELTNGIMLCPTSLVLELGYLYDSRPALLEIDKAEAVDIDDILDLEQARAWDNLIKTGQYVIKPPSLCI